jgi:glycosyltransferase involved in cell wall biosynthesis
VKQRWHLITGEYPPQPGGVADYTRNLAQGLTNAGDEVFVWAPQADGPSPCDDGIAVHRLPGHFGPTALAELDAALTRSPGRILLQYTPHAFGCKAMNVPLCAWLWARPRMLDVMFHEVAYPFVPGQPLKHKVLASVQRMMASLLLRAAERVFISVPGWESLLRPLAARFPAPIWTPVPSNLPVRVDPDAVAQVRARLPRKVRRVAGHFGTYSGEITSVLEPALLEILAGGRDIHCMLLGRGSTDFAARLVDQHPSLADRVTATGPLEASAAAAHLAGCDVLVQPYPGGITSRRGSAMAALAQGLAVITNSGEWCEPLWHTSGAVELVAFDGMGAACVALLNDPKRRAELGRRAVELYQARFSLEHTVRAVRALPVPSPMAVAG